MWVHGEGRTPLAGLSGAGAPQACLRCMVLPPCAGSCTQLIQPPAACSQSAHRTAASAQQHFLSLRNATLLQLVCGMLWPLVQHYQYDSRRHKLFQQVQRRRQQQQQQEEQPEGQQQAEARQASGPARQR